ncbi:unnamed protein product [Paramecium primaurelia]|uniref:Uncharacterized protein n=1 Tax=Paramecium primaurelia TaxID=5886 RepID=A0A8S1L9Q6_PARPR|nr:unnamed protein product [Paramecium primaurelia]
MKRSSNKLQKQNASQPQTENRGKPSQLKFLQLNAPGIWTNKHKSLYIIKYLTDNGRHNFLHQAGKHSNKDADHENQQNNQDTKIYFEQAQEIAEKLFNIQCSSKRCIVFYFRYINEQKLTYDFSEYIQNKDFVDILSSIQNLLTENFIQDLIIILSSQNNINSIADMLLENKGAPSNYSHIIKNLFIQKKIDTMIEQKTITSDIETIRNEFEDFLKDPQTKYLVRMFICDILNIFYTQTIDQSNQDEQFQMAEVNDF